MKKEEILFKLYEENIKETRHMDTQRTTISNTVFVLSIAIIGYIIKIDASANELLFLALTLTLLGFYGLLSVLKLYERYHFYKNKSITLLREIDQTIGNNTILESIQKADDRHANKYLFLVKFKVYKLWCYLHIFIIIIGFYLTSKAF